MSVNLVTGLRRGFLANVDYRMYTDNINWEALHTSRRTLARQMQKTAIVITAKHGESPVGKGMGFFAMVDRWTLYLDSCLYRRGLLAASAAPLQLGEILPEMVTRRLLLKMHRMGLVVSPLTEQPASTATSSSVLDCTDHVAKSTHKNSVTEVARG